ncbi:MAG: cysteine desulfurase [Treponema sp.]|jgi:cysteine desulfurase|nr:cysteine desulfurase [Treponema sp.]
MKVYIDYNATTPLNEAVKTAMIDDFAFYGNASSIHTTGRLARARIEDARSKVAALVGAKQREIIFTSGGSESNNTVFQTMRILVERGATEGKPSVRNEIVTTAIEHPCVLNSANFLRELGFTVTFLPVDKYGVIKIDALKAALNDKTLLVSVMAANNEIGTIQDIKEITALAKSAGAFVHTDAVQAVGKIPVNVEEWGVDYLTMSAHKIYGPKGVGALYVRGRSGIAAAPLFPLIHGGHQEDGLRAGTYNNLGVFGFGKAAEIAKQRLAEYKETIFPLREHLREGLVKRMPNITVNGHPTDVIPNTLNVSFPGAEGESILLAMDLAGIDASTGSACASGSLAPSHVIMAMGVESEAAHGSIRFSLGWGITREAIDYIIDTLPPIIERLRSMSTLT